MRRILFVAMGGTFLASAIWLLGQNSGARVRLVPTNNIAAARSKYPLSDYNRISTNTLAFEEWGLRWMLAKANELREKWNLDIPKPLAVNDVLFQLKATLHGVEGSLATRNNRYEWIFTDHRFTRFRDRMCAPMPAYSLDLESEREKLRRLARTASIITAHGAESIARDALHGIGLTEESLRLAEPPSLEQETLEEPDGTVLCLPRFKVEWRSKEEEEPQADEFDYRVVRMQVSGITGKLVYYSNLSPHTPREPLPTNYFRMLGLPDNYRDTLDERTRARLGLPPLRTPAVAKERQN